MRISYKVLIMILALFIVSMIGSSIIENYKREIKDEHIKQLEQSLQEQIQEVEVYRGILEEYQTEGIINE